MQTGTEINVNQWPPFTADPPNRKRFRWTADGEQNIRAGMAPSMRIWGAQRAVGNPAKQNLYPELPMHAKGPNPYGIYAYQTRDEDTGAFAANVPNQWYGANGVYVPAPSDWEIPRGTNLDIMQAQLLQ